MDEKLYRNIIEIRKQKSFVDGIPASVAFVKSLVGEADSDSDWVVAMTLLMSEYSWHGMKVEEEETARAILDRFPDEPMAYINLASCLSASLGKSSEAVEVALLGVSVSRKQQKFQRHALQTLARTAKAARSYGVVEDAIKQLIGLPKEGSCHDVNIETDFLKSLPKSEVDEKLVAEYLKIASYK